MEVPRRSTSDTATPKPSGSVEIPTAVATTARKSKGSTQKKSAGESRGSKVTPKNSNKNQKRDKKSKGKGMEEDGSEDVVFKDVTQVLDPLLEEIFNILDAFSDDHKNILWYKNLKLRHSLLSIVTSNITTRRDLAGRQELKDSFICPPIHELPPETQCHYEALKTKFTDIEKHRNKAIAQALEPVAPSLYCLYRAYHVYQLDSRMAVRAGRPGPYPIPLELLHPAFRTYTYWSVVNPVAKPGCSDETKFIDIDTRIQLEECIRMLQQSMPKLYSAHDERLRAFLDALKKIFPENREYEWCMNEPANVVDSDIQSRYKIDIVYRYKTTRIPLIFVEVKLEMGEGGDPFWQNNRLYQTYIKDPRVLATGAPVFFVQLCGVHMGVGGGFCDVKTAPPVVLQLGGYINLQYDYFGRSFNDALNTLWALHQGIRQISSTFDGHDSQHDKPDIPHFSENVGIKITETLFPGLLYVANWITNGPEAFPEIKNSKLVFKIIYSGLAKETYGKDVHIYLSKHGMAPFYFTDFHLKFPHLPHDMVPLETYHVMEYLPPPSGTSVGWITLHDFKQKYPEEAARSKYGIAKALEAIINMLQLGHYVHGDLRMNNVLICVAEIKNGNPTCIVQPRPNTQVPYLKVIDFDWAGTADQVRYPLQRNPEIWWPGHDGMPISTNHDKEMIYHWLSLWPSLDGDKPIQEPTKEMQAIFGESGSLTKKPLSSMKVVFGH